jgi:hypothetical protein
MGHEYCVIESRAFTMNIGSGGWENKVKNIARILKTECSEQYEDNGEEKLR